MVRTCPGAAAAAPPPATRSRRYTVRLNPLLVAGLAPKSLAAEQYRQLRTRLSHAEGASNLRTVLVTSPQKGEGKSITAANLALTMAQELQRRVMLVDADLRKPSLQRAVRSPRRPRACPTYLAGAAELKDVMTFLPEHNLTVAPRGRDADESGGAARVDGDAAAARPAAHALRPRDSRHAAGAAARRRRACWRRWSTASLLVVRAGVTPKPAIENALRAFDSSRLLGVVLNESGMEQDYSYEARGTRRCGFGVRSADRASNRSRVRSESAVRSYRDPRDAGLQPERIGPRPDGLRLRDRADLGLDGAGGERPRRIQRRRSGGAALEDRRSSRRCASSASTTTISTTSRSSTRAASCWSACCRRPAPPRSSSRSRASPVPSLMLDHGIVRHLARRLPHRRRRRGGWPSTTSPTTRISRSGC